MTTYDREFIDRYIMALRSIGITHMPELNLLSIDYRGFSSEIAASLDNENYLKNRRIILSEEQIIEGTATNDVFEMTAYKSMQKSLERYREMLLHTPLIITVEHLQSIEELILQKHHFVVSVPYEVQKKKNEQLKKLASGLQGENIISLHFYQDVLESIQTHGDVRGVPSEELRVSFSLPQSFYTSAFGGVYVLQYEGMTPLVIWRDEISFQKMKGYESVLLNTASSQDVIDGLRSRGLIRIAYQKQQMKKSMQHILQQAYQKADLPWYFEDVLANPAYQEQVLEAFPLLQKKYSLLQDFASAGDEDISSAVRKVLKAEGILPYFAIASTGDDEISFPPSLKKTIQKLIDDIAFNHL